MPKSIRKCSIVNPWVNQYFRSEQYAKILVIFGNGQISTVYPRTPKPWPKLLLENWPYFSMTNQTTSDKCYIILKIC